MANFYQVKKTIHGVKYTAQFNGMGTALDAMDNWYNDEGTNMSVKKITDYVLANVIVDPKVKVDDFKKYSELQDVVAWGRKVMQGEIQPEDSEADEKPAKAKA